MNEKFVDVAYISPSAEATPGFGHGTPGFVPGSKRAPESQKRNLNDSFGETPGLPNGMNFVSPPSDEIELYQNEGGARIPSNEAEGQPITK